jgi:hypothetical protein
MFLIEQPDKTNKIQFLGCFPKVVYSELALALTSRLMPPGKIVKKQKRQSTKREHRKPKKNK